MYRARTLVALCVVLLLTAGAMAQDRSAGIRITLDEAKARAAGAAASNAAQFSVDAARYHRQAAQADYFPKLAAEFFNLHYNKFMGETIQLSRRQASVPLLGKDETIVALTVVQPITQLLQVKQAVTIARADEEIAKAQVAQLTAQASENIERVYFGLLIAQRYQITAKKKVEALETQSSQVGTVATPAATSSERRAALFEAEKESASAESKVDELTESLNALIGFTRNTKLILDITEPEDEKISLPEATQSAVDNSPEVVEAEQTLVKAKAASRLSRLDYIPSVAVLGSYINQTQPALPTLPSDFSFIGLTATLNIFDFGKREKTISERNAQVKIAEANVAMVRAKVAANVQKSFLELQRTQTIRDLTRRLAAYQEASLEEISAQAAREAEIVQAELDYRNAHTQLKHLVNGR